MENDPFLGLRLHDGRQLAYAEYGDADGVPVFLFHGTPGSRLYHHPDESIAVSLGARIIVPDRPGFGHSDWQPGRTLLHWPNDVAALADTLGLAQFAVAGVSGGGPYVAACAFAMPDRIAKAAIISGSAPFCIEGASLGLAPVRRVGFEVIRRAPLLLRAFLWALANPQRNPARFAHRYSAGMPEADLEIYRDPKVEAMKLATYAESGRQGVRGFAQELQILAHFWGFKLQDIRLPVRLWHGNADASTPLTMALYMANAILQCEVTILPGEGHSVFYKHWREILAELVS